MRPTKDEYFSAIAGVASTRSTCLRNQVGAVLVQSGNIIGTGFNGAASSVKSCDELGQCDRERLGIAPGTQYEKCIAIHAELNALIQVAKHGGSTMGATIYTTSPPCLMCARAIINAGIAEVVFTQDPRYFPEEPVAMLGDAGVKVREL